MYMEALKTGVETAEERRRKMDPQGPRLAWRNIASIVSLCLRTYVALDGWHS